MKEPSLADVFRIIKREAPYSDTFERIECAYWWLTHHHCGQWSQSYSDLCRLGNIYSPGAMDCEIEYRVSRSHIYQAICEEVGCCPPLLHQDLVEQFDMSEARASYCVRLTKGEIADEHLPGRTQAWLRQCYHRPSARELAHHAIDVLIGGFGVEAIQSDGDILATYSNTGDTYSATVLYDEEWKEFIVTSWGGWLEEYERENGPIE